jgi:asparagine synthase (glutamine-hydrolysing)
VLQKVDRASMHESLEVRVPLLDREVVGIALRTDWRSAVDLVQRRGKLPLRAALQREAGFQTIAKRGFSVPMSRWLRGPLKEMIFDLLLSRREIAGVPLNVRALEQIYRFHRLRIRSAPWLLWRLLSLALWETRHYRATPIHA